MRPDGLRERRVLINEEEDVVVTVLLYNFFGDGLRDAADPYAMSGNG